MKKIHGIAASGGIVLGRIAIFHREKHGIPKRNTSDVEAEQKRFKEALSKAVDELAELYRRSLKEIGEKNSVIFQIHIMMLQDDEFVNAVLDTIRSDHVNAEYAVWQTGKHFSEHMAKIKNEYLRARAADIKDITYRLICCLDAKAPLQPKGLEVTAPSIIAADELTPSETIQMDPSKVLAILTSSGSCTSHASILARTMGIPTVVGIGADFKNLQDGMLVSVDGTSGEIVLDPDMKTQGDCKKQRSEYLRHIQVIREAKDTKIVTAAKRAIAVEANISRPEDVEVALFNGADGIGLFRSEFLYMGRDCLPEEDEQFRAYRFILEHMEGRPVVIRTADIGADKRIPYLSLPHEKNPALGYRAIRICLREKDLFFTQLRAMMRASAYGKLRIMLPMVTSVEEVAESRKILEQVKENLAEHKIPFDPGVKLGITVETPAAAILCDDLTKLCDFVSIGTNDLTQYTLAVDRTNASIAEMYNTHHPAILRMVRMIAKSATEAGIPVGVCGESAADATLTQYYLDAGITEFSVAPTSVPELKSTLKTLMEKE